MLIYGKLRGGVARWKTGNVIKELVVRSLSIGSSKNSAGDSDSNLEP